MVAGNGFSSNDVIVFCMLLRCVKQNQAFWMILNGFKRVLKTFDGNAWKFDENLCESMRADENSWKTLSKIVNKAQQVEKTKNWIKKSLFLGC